VPIDTPPDDRPAPLGIDELTQALWVHPDGPQRFVVEGLDWWDGDRVFGGMVVAQAVSAAVQTVDPAMPIHSLHGYFLRPTPAGRPVILTVRTVRQGRSFAVREVLSQVDGKETFTMQCSFHRPEEGDEYQLPMPKGMGDPDQLQRTEVPIPFRVCELGPTPRRPDGSFESTRRVWLRTEADLPDDPLLHACVVAYLSDMTGAAFRPMSLGTWGTHTDASLDHAVWFHRPVRADQWLLYDPQAVVNVAGRATVRGAMFDAEGALVVSMVQELLIRPLEHPNPEPAPGWANTQF
jgi:acyl-CoA thioesterase II